MFSDEYLASKMVALQDFGDCEWKEEGNTSSFWADTQVCP